MNAANRLTPSAPKQTFSSAITSNAMQGLIKKSLKDSKAVARFTSTMISAVNASEQLKACDPGSIVAAALRGEGMGLNLGMGYYIVPYGQTCTFVIGYKGLIALALATGQYEDIDCMDIREGEYQGRDPRTGKPKLEFNVYEMDEDREKAQIIGYYAYFQLKDGMFRSEFWSMNKLIFHAEKYAQAFDREKYERFISGEMTAEEEAKMRKSTPWYDVGYGQDRMCRKTVLRSLLNSGYAPLSNEVRYALDNDSEAGIIPDMPVINVDKATGEVTGQAASAPAIEAAQAEEFFEAAAVDEELARRNVAQPEKAPAAAPETAKKKPLKAEAADKPQTIVVDSLDGGFFGGGEG